MTPRTAVPCALLALLAMLGTSGCLATKVVTVPVKVAYGAGKLAAKGTAAAVRAVVPDGEDTAPQPGAPQDGQDAEPPRQPAR